MQWIVENFVKESSYLELVAAIKEAGHKVHEINGDFKRSEISEFDSLREPTLFLGSINMCEMVFKELMHASPVVYNDFHKYLCTSYYTHLGEFLFNDDYSFVTLRELHRQKFNFYNRYGKETLIFVRPDSGNKTFQAGLVDMLDLDKFVESHKEYEHSLVLVSTPKTIKGEWRFVVTDEGDIVTYSTYQYQGKVTRVPGAPQGAINLVQKILKVGYHPNSIYCIDVAQDADDNFWLLELTSFSSAGLYCTDKKKVVKRASEIAERDWKSDRLLMKYAEKPLNKDLYSSVEIST
jgi:hypothetical protein